MIEKLDYKIISSGSKGNAVRIRDIMIDCGVPYRAIEKEIAKCKLLFLTHIHSDHINRATLDTIRTKFPHITVVGNYQVAEKYGVNIISNKKPIATNKWRIQPFEVLHDVVTQGLTIHTHDGLDIIYVTDSAGTDTWREGRYDYLFVESNYDEHKMAQVRNSEYGYDVISGALRHTSTQQSKAFYYMNRKSKDSPYIELHRSQRFY